MDITPDKQNQSLARKSLSMLKWNYFERLISILINSLSVPNNDNESNISKIKIISKYMKINVVTEII